MAQYSSKSRDQPRRQMAPFGYLYTKIFAWRQCGHNHWGRRSTITIAAQASMITFPNFFLWLHCNVVTIHKYKNFFVHLYFKWIFISITKNLLPIYATWMPAFRHFWRAKSSKYCYWRHHTIKVHSVNMYLPCAWLLARIWPRGQPTCALRIAQSCLFTPCLNIFISQWKAFGKEPGNS